MVIFIVDLNHDLVSSLGDNNQTRQKPPIGDFNLLGYHHRSMIVITSLAHCLANYPIPRKLPHTIPSSHLAPRILPSPR